MSNPIIQIKRAYAPATTQDGWRILVDRLWPRVSKKETAQVKDWDKNVAPSTELRKWFGHEEDKWPEFQKKYKLELKENKTALESLIELVKKHPVVTLLYAAKDDSHNNAVVLREVLINMLKK